MPQALALTLGEPAGIGPDITLAAWSSRSQLSLPPFYVLGDAAFLERRAQLLGLSVPVATVEPSQAAATFASALPVVSLGLPITAQPGKPDASSAPAAIEAIRRGVADVIGGRASAVVTNPIAKSVLYQAGFREPGHTEYLARLVQEMTGDVVQPVMLLWSPKLAVVPITIHIALKDVFAHLTSDLVVKTARIVVRDYAKGFGIARPRLAIAGLNPHAGEDGTMGKEDATVLAPAVRQLQAEGFDVRGPLPADTMFHPAARQQYDVALCAYHDQALIPVKTLAFDTAVNATLGLPFVRTSPDHGTAFDIAGTGRADPASLIASLKLAARLAERAPAPAAA